MMARFALKERAINRADWFIIACMGMVSCQFALLAISHGTDLLPLWLKLYAGGSGFILLQALLFSYIGYLVGAARVFILSGYLPFVLHFSNLLINASLNPGKYSFVYGFTVFTIDASWQLWLGSLTLVLAVALPIVSLYMIASYRKRLKANFSEISELDLDWLRKLLIGSLIVLMSGVILVAPVIKSFQLGEHVLFSILLVFISVYNLYLGFYSFKQRLVPAVVATEKGTKEQSFLSASELVLAKAELTKHMTEHKPFTHRRLTLDELAQQLYWPSFKLTEVINQGFDKNFYEFVNFYRVEQVKEILQQNTCARINLLDTALAAGFNSKTAFNTVFKRFEGVTPSEFRKAKR